MEGPTIRGGDVSAVPARPAGQQLDLWVDTPPPTTIELFRGGGLMDGSPESTDRAWLWAWIVLGVPTWLFHGVPTWVPHRFAICLSEAFDTYAFDNIVPGFVIP